MARHRLRVVPKLVLRRKMGGVYFIELRKLPLVKVGYTTDIYQRLASLQTNCPFEASVVGFYPGLPTTEDFVHGHLLSEQYHSEWFKYTRRLERMMVLFDAWMEENAHLGDYKDHAFDQFVQRKVLLHNEDCDGVLIDDHITHEWLLHA